MKIVFEDKALEELYLYGTTKDKRFRKYIQNKDFMQSLVMRIKSIEVAQTYDDLFNISPLHYERLKHDFSGYSSFRIKSRKYVERIICKEHQDYIELSIIELNDTHYGNKK